jgi:uncharacterized phage-associated protein
MKSAHEVANYIVCFFQEAGDPISNLKLQKLLYYVQGWHLAFKGECAFQDRLEAWVHGPVQPGVYGSFKHNRWNPIVDAVNRPNLPPEMVNVVDAVLEAYGGDSGYELELRTHQEPPWLLARGDLPQDAESNRVIDVLLMKSFFDELKNASPNQ